MRTDAQLHAAVAERLADDPSVDASKIAIAVSDGIVTLTGTVPSYWQKVQAEKAVVRVAGVRGAANDLVVDIPAIHERDDADIARAAAEMLAWHSDLPDGIKATVTRGWVTLTGTVDAPYQKEEAERGIRHLNGVRGVINDIAVKPASNGAGARKEVGRIRG